MEPVTEIIREQVRGAFIVPRKTGNRACRDPAEGRRAPRVENR